MDKHTNYLHQIQESAQKILKNMIPRELPTSEEFEFLVDYKSSDEVGGDLYDVTDIGDYYCCYVLDVAGHGILASIISVIMKSFLMNIAYNYKQGINKRRFPEIVLDLNSQLCSNTSPDVFATLFLCFIDKKTKILYTVSAGHIPQYIIRSDEVIQLGETGPLLGAFEDAKYTCNVYKLREGDQILLFTDGVVEASNGDNVFGYMELEKVLKTCEQKPLATTIDEINKAINKYAGGKFQDDVTILGIKRRI